MNKCLDYLESLGVDTSKLCDILDITSLTDNKSLLMELVVKSIKDDKEEYILPAVIRAMLSEGILPTNPTEYSDIIME